MFGLSLDDPNAPDTFFQLFFGVPIGFVDGPGGFAEVMELTELMGDTGQCFGDRPLNRSLAIGDDSGDGNGDGIFDFENESGEVILGGGQETASHENGAADAIPQDPQNLMPDIGLQPVECENDTSLGSEYRTNPLWIVDGECAKFIVSIEQISHGSVGDEYGALGEELMDLGDAAVLEISELPDERDDIQPELVAGQCDASFGLRVCESFDVCTGKWAKNST